MPVGNGAGTGPTPTPCWTKPCLPSHRPGLCDVSRCPGRRAATSAGGRARRWFGVWRSGHPFGPQLADTLVCVVAAELGVAQEGSAATCTFPDLAAVVREPVGRDRCIVGPGVGSVRMVFLVGRLLLGGVPQAADASQLRSVEIAAQGFPSPAHQRRALPATGAVAAFLRNDKKFVSSHGPNCRPRTTHAARRCRRGCIRSSFWARLVAIPTG